YVMTYREALGVAETMGWTKTTSWKTGGRHQRRGYTMTSVAENSGLWHALQGFLMSPQKLKEKVIAVGRQSD
ncbi:MAG TPA: hypothetical protein VE779_08765, partial [Candidatus Angelobacter sp.]|nr:hypothetical protein [Candidatus Angelobacter sp.]